MTVLYLKKGGLMLKYEIFRSIVETGNFTRTAETLNLSQSAVSHAIRSLETELGFELFTRSKKGVEITKAGLEIQSFVTSMLSAKRRLDNKINAINGIESGHLRIASIGSASTIVLPELIHRYSRLYPNVKLTFKEGGLDEMRNLLESDRADIIFIVRELLTTDMYAEECFTDEIVAMVPRSYELGHMDSIPIETIEDYPFVLSYAHPHKYMQILFKRFNVNPNIKYSFNLNNTCMAMVEKGLGLSILPDSVMKNYSFDFDILSFDKPIKREIVLVTKKGNESNPLVRAFYEVNKQRLVDVIKSKK